MSTENSSRSEKEETEAPKKGGPADAGDASAAGAVSPQMPSPTPALGDDGELGWGEGHLAAAFATEHVGMHTDLRGHLPLTDAGASELRADNA